MTLIKSKKVKADKQKTSALTTNVYKSALIKKDKVKVALVAPSEEEKKSSLKDDVVWVSVDGSKKESKVEEVVEQELDFAPSPPVSPSITEEIQRMKEEAIEELENSRAEGERIISEAQAKAKKLIEESKLYCQSVQAAAEKEGFIIGKEEGIKAGYQEVASLIDEAKRTLQQALMERERLLKNAEFETAKFAIKIAERVINSEVTLNYDIVLNMVRATLERVKDREHVIIKVNQADLENVKNNKELFSKIVEGIKSLEIQADPRIERGGCIIETNLGTVDARIGTQLATLEAAFKAASLSEVESELEGESQYGQPD